MRSQRFRVWVSAALLSFLVRPSGAEDFTGNVLSIFDKSEAKSAVLYESKSFRVTARRFGNGEQQPLFRTTRGTFYIYLNRFKAVVVPEGKTRRLRRGQVSYLPANAVGGGLRWYRIEPHVKFSTRLEAQVSPRGEASVSVPEAEADAALKERALPKQFARAGDFPWPAKGKTAAAARMLDAPDADLHIMTFAGKTALSKSNRSSLWFALAGQGTLSNAGKSFALRPNSLLVLPAGTPNAITVTPTPGEKMRILLITHKTL